MTFFFYLFMALFIIVCLFMILLILIQKGRGGGLSSAFGGAGGNTAFGSKTGDVLTWATSIVFGIFLLLAIVLNLMANARQDDLASTELEGLTPPAFDDTGVPAAQDGTAVDETNTQTPPVEAAPTTQP